MARTLRPLALLLLCFITTQAFSEEHKESPASPLLLEHSFSTEPTSLVNMTAMPSSIVNGCVNVITGDYCIAGLDHTVSGPDSFALGHSYFSQSLKEGTLGNGWNFFHNHLLQVYQPGKIEYVIGYAGSSESESSSEELKSKNSTLETEPETPSCVFFDDETNACPITEESISGSDYTSTSVNDSWESVSKTVDDFMDYDEIRCPPADSDNFDPEDLDTDGDDTETKHYYPPHPRIPIFFGDASHHDHHRDRDDYPGAPGVSKNPPFIFLVEPSGGKIAFKGKYKHHKITDLKIQTRNTGFTNVAGGELSGRTNIKNIEPSWDRKNDIWTVKLGDGTVRRYERQWKKSEMKRKHPHHAAFYRDYHLTKETLPSGNIVVYDYNNKFEITSIKTYNKDASHKLNWVEFKQKTPGQFSKLPSLHVKSSDNQDIYYYFKKLKGGYLNGTYSVSGIKRTGQPYMRFKYSSTSPRHKRRVMCQEQDGGYFIETKYYRAAENKMGSRTVEPKNKSERRFLKNRVRMQLAPVGPKDKKAITHRYFYYKDKGKKSGHTTVRDANSDITRYFWNGSKRLTKVERRTADNTLLKRETFTWGRGKLQGNLLARTLYDENEHPIFSRTFKYDKHGNVTEETVYGRFMNDKGALKVDSEGMPVSATCDKISRSYTYSDDGFNLKTSERDPLGNYIYYDYHKGTNLLKSKFTCDKKEIKKREFYSHDKNGQVEEVILDDGSKEDRHNLHDVTERHITRYILRNERPHFGEPEEIAEYYYDFDKKKEILLKKTVNSYSKNGFISKKRVYDADGKLASTTEYDHDKVGRIIYSKDSLGREEHFTYDKSGRLIKKTGPRSDVSWHYSYNKAGKVTEETEIHKSGLKLTTKYEYDLLGRKIAVIDPQGNPTRFEYDPLDRITKITYPTIFDHQGIAITPTKKYTYEKLGTRVIETNEAGHATRVDYNAEGKPFAKYFPDGTAWYYRYDENGNEIREVAPNHVRTYKHYDAFNRLIASNMYTIERVALSLKKLKYSSFHLVEEVSPTNEILITRYDAAGRKSATTLTSPSKSQKRETTYHYDALSRLAEERMLLEKDYTAICYVYDDLDRVVSESTKDGRGNLHAQKIYSYDEEGNLAQVSESIMGKIATATTSWHPHGLPKEETNAEGHTWKYFYDYAFPNVHGQTVIKKTTVDPRGVTQIDVHDTRGNLSCSYKLDPSGNTLCKQELYYDAANNLVRTHDHSILDFKKEKLVINALTYGPQNRIEKITEAVNTAEEKTTSYFYNAIGQKEKIVHADGTSLHHTYDEKGRLQEYYANDKSLHYKYKYDPSDRIRSIENLLTGQKTKRDYNEIGDIVTETLESGLKLKVDYDPIGRVSKLTLPDSSHIHYSYSPVHLQSVARADWKYEITARDLSGHILSSKLPKKAGTITYAYDLLGRRIETFHQAFNEQAAAFDAVGNLLHLKRDGIESHYTYDFLSQLATEAGPVFHAYTYDSLHNRRSLDLKPYVVNSLHSVLSDGTQSYIYDKRGNRVDSDKTKYRYDALDRLIEVEMADKRIAYSYDALNRRIQKETFVKGSKGWKSKDLEKYIYHLDNEIGSTDASGKIKELRILGEGLGAEIGATIAIELQDKLYVALNDRRGNIVGLLDPNNSQLVESYRYDAFGNETCDHRKTTNAWRFSSKRVDPETGLVYFGRRYYSPSLGKWLTHDPLGLKAGPNLYAYVLNNPLTMFDLYGLAPLRSKVGPGLNGHPDDLHNRGFREHYESEGYTFHYGKPDEKANRRVISISYGTRKVNGISTLGVNGINMSFKRSLGLIKYISDKTKGLKVELVYDPAVGMMGPALMAGVQREFKIESQAERNLQERFDQLTALYGQEEKFIVIGYSRGAIQVNNAVSKLDEPEQKRIIGIGLCPAAIFLPSKFLKAENIVNADPLRDLVPYSDAFGWAQSLKENPSMDHIIYCKSDPEVKETVDHSYDSRTYERNLIESLNRNIHNHMRRE